MSLKSCLMLAAGSVALALAGCAESAKQPVSSVVGADPALPEPETALIPTLKIAEAVGWPAGAAPSAAQGLKVQAFATGLDHPRWLHVLPNGDVLVAETNAPERPEQGKGIRGYFQKDAMKKAGAVTKSANRITLLRDADGDGTAETKTVFLENLNSPFGMALANGKLYVANTDGVVAAPYTEGATQISATPMPVTDLPAGARNHHWTKSLIASKDGSKLYATVGSNSNIAENGMDEEEGRAAIWEIDAASGQKRLFATGLRNPNGMDWEPSTGLLWTAVNERDELGPNLVPDYITSVKDGAFYGWPWSYFGQTVDTRVKPANPEMVARAIAPDYAVGAHTASLGLAFAEGARLGSQFADGAFVGQHGSWNRDPYSGYKVIFVPFSGGRPSGQAVDVLTGFLDAEKEIAFGRPVGVEIGRDGSLLVADDVGNAIWRVASAAETPVSLAESAPGKR
jgi:glucose/arabinose dehydrogenase